MLEIKSEPGWGVGRHLTSHCRRAAFAALTSPPDTLMAVTCGSAWSLGDILPPRPPGGLEDLRLNQWNRFLWKNQIMTKLQIPPRGCPDNGFGEVAAFTGASDAPPQGFCKKEIFF